MDWILTLSIISGQLIKIPFGLGGITLLDIAVMILVTFHLFKKFRLKKPPLFIKGGLLFLIICIISLSLTPLNLSSIQYLNSFSYTVRFGFYLLVGWLVLSRQQSFNVNILKISGISLAVLGIIQFIFLPDLSFLQKDGWDPHFYRTASTFLDPNFLGAYLVLTLILIVQNLKNTKLNILIFTAAFFALLTTFSRSSYLMFLVSFLTFSFLKRSLKLALLSTFLFFILLQSFKIQTALVNKVTPLDRSETASLRFSTWKQGIEIFQNYPILGIGFNAYKYAIKQYNLGNEQFLKGKGSTTNDSSLLYILSTTGILGLLSYSVFILGLLNIKSPVVISAIIGLLAHSFFVNSLFYPFIMLWIILVASSFYDGQPVK